MASAPKHFLDLDVLPPETLRGILTESARVKAAGRTNAAPLAGRTLALNEIGVCNLSTTSPVAFDPYTDNRETGAFILIDPLSNETLGAAMIVDIEGKEETRGQVSTADRTARFGHRGAVVAIEDTESALLLERELFDRGANVAVVNSLEPNAAKLATAAGLIVIVVGAVPPSAIDLRRVATFEAVRQLGRLGVLVGHEEQLVEGEGI